ncbi:hypothetical protein PHBOTO_004111 [Pseudozyma hubeiensis]|nr:hypothetical protein PHBOTO_004111 [Pseudozyma hubeiensis]
MPSPHFLGVRPIQFAFFLTNLSIYIIQTIESAPCELDESGQVNMLGSLLSKVLPLAQDPFPPTHRAGSEFEGFFIRLESHSGRPQSTSQRQDISSSRTKNVAQDRAKASPSRIPRLASKPRNGEPSSSSPQRLRRRKPRSSSTCSSSSSSSADVPESPTPVPRRASRIAAPIRFTPSYEQISPKTMLTDIDPVFASPESLLPRPTPSDHSVNNAWDPRISLPASSPGDLILVVCELQSAPIDQRICIYLRWIVHGEEAALYDALHAPSESKMGNGDGERLPVNASAKKELQSFEIIKYIPSWQLKVGPKATSFSPQPFRIDLSDALQDDSSGFFEVSADGNLAVDLTLYNPDRSQSNKQVSTRVRLRSTKFSPWQSTSSLPMGSRGPEGLIQHLGPLLPLHWYVHSSSAPCMFSLEHLNSTDHDDLELENAVAAGRALLHVEKNWGQAFPDGWMWVHAASPLPDPSLPHSRMKEGASCRLSLAGGSILGLTAFLVGIRVKVDGKRYEWDFAPPTAVAPKLSISSSVGKVTLGPGLRMYRNFKEKTFKLDLWTPTRWATIEVSGEESSFATQIPGPRKGGWQAGYCHHSYRCSAKVRLRERDGVVRTVGSAVRDPVGWVRRTGEFWSGGGGKEGDGLGWKTVAEVRLEDRVALEFGGDFAR